MYELLNNRKKKLDYLTSFQERLKEYQSIALILSEAIEITQWEVDAFQNAPKEIADASPEDLLVIYKDDLETVIQIMPELPDISHQFLAGSQLMTSSGSISAYGYISSLQDCGTPGVIEYAQRYTAEYQKIQDSRDRPKEIREMISTLGYGGLLERFMLAEKEYTLYTSGIGEKIPAAFAIRNALDGLKGELFIKAKVTAKGKKAWETMAERLTKNRGSDTAYKVLLDQGRIHSQLINQLSTIGKDREGANEFDLNDTWTITLDHFRLCLHIIIEK